MHVAAQHTCRWQGDQGQECPCWDRGEGTCWGGKRTGAVAYIQVYNEALERPSTATHTSMAALLLRCPPPTYGTRIVNNTEVTMGPVTRQKYALCIPHHLSILGAGGAEG